MSDAGALPATIGRYRIEGALGRGAMGVVYRARDTLIERTVAIKTVLRMAHGAGQEHDLVARFRVEAQAAGRLMHPNIVAIHDYGETDDLAYIAMEYIDGTPLSSLLGDRPVPLARARDWLADLLAALDYAHGRGVVHRDVKPANLLVTRDDRIKIGDFGIARIDTSTLTQTGAMIGTPSYMSPEQFLGDAIDGRSDLFSTGIVLYQLLTGQRPFTGSATTVMHQIMNHTPPPPSSVNAALPAALDAVVMQALAKTPAQRHASARAFQHAMTAALAAAGAADATILAGPAPDAADATVLAPGTAAGLAPAPGDWARRMAATTSQGSGATGALPAWLTATAPHVEALLTRQVGPMAKLLLRRVAQSAPDFDALAASLLSHIPSLQARAAFEREMAAIQTRIQPPTRSNWPATSPMTTPAVDAPPVTPELAANLAFLLAAAIGPIAGIVVKRALRLPCGRDEFVARLAAHIEGDGPRARFLQQARNLN